MAPLDETDRLIVDALRADGRMSMRTLAERLHISRANAYTRVARLERDGVITGYAALVDPVRYGYGLSAYVYLDIAQRSWKSVRGQLLSMPEVDHVALVSGEHDILLRVTNMLDTPDRLVAPDMFARVLRHTARVGQP